MPSVRKRGDAWIVLLLSLLGVASLAGIASLQPREQIQSALRGENDFLQLYIGARLAGTGTMYSPQANWALQAELTGKRAEAVRYSRLPFYAVLLRPLAWLPYVTAYWVFQAVSIASFLAFLWLFVPRVWELAILAGFSIPFLATLRLGQDTAIVVLFFSLFYFLSEKRRCFGAGLALSLCLIKFHLFPPVALALLARREWAVIRGAAVGCGALLALGTLAGGWGWPGEYLAVLRNPQLHPEAAIMPNVHGLAVQLFGGSMVAEAGAASLVMAAFGWIAWRQPCRGLVCSAALVAGLLVSYHAYVQDALILLPALALMKEGHGARVPLALLVFATSPFPYLLLLLGAPWNAALTVLLMVTLGSLALAAREANGVGAERGTMARDPFNLG